MYFTTVVLFLFLSSVQHNGGFLPGIILLTQYYYHRGTRLNAMRRSFVLQPMIPPKRFDIFPPLTEGCSEGLPYMQ